MERLFLLTACITSLFFVGESDTAVAQTDLPRTHVLSITPGVTPFIGRVLLSTPDFSTLKSVQFEVVPKPGSVARPISAVYYADYLVLRGYVDSQYVRTTLPVFGLYADYMNTVNLTYRYNDGTSERETLTTTTAGYDDPSNYGSPIVVQPHTSGINLSYDFILIKSYQGTQSPVIIDTDGVVRWVGTSGESYLSSIFYENSFYTSYIPPGGAAQTGIERMELDGSFQFLADYSSSGVTSTDHHNYDRGQDGILVEVDTVSDQEANILEVDTAGTILRQWDLGAILSAAMQAGGDDPSQFVVPTQDWFHNNSACYRASDNSLIVSSREDFVIALDYDSGAIKWILGDTTKKWAQFPSLRRYALALVPGSTAPVGQHAVSITHDDHLLLFDNGTNSAFQMPAGVARAYSSPRKYQIDTAAMVAIEVWNYEQGQTISVRFTGSTYEDDPLNYLINYSGETVGDSTYTDELVGLAPSGEKVFDYRYSSNATGTFAWNAIPVHFENLVFTGPQTALAAGHAGFFIGEQALNGGVYYLTLPADGNTFGYYSYLTDPHYIYHFGLGYEYVFDAADSQRGVFLYDFASNSFFYTSPSFPFPYLYDFDRGSVLYYFLDSAGPGTSGTRLFYDFSTSEYVRK